MTAETESVPAVAPAGGVHSAPLAARAIVFLFLAVVPFRIVATGWLPGDDALRHAAKAVSGKRLERGPGPSPRGHDGQPPRWHAVLERVHAATGADAHALALFSIVSVYLALVLPAVFLLRRPEAWALALACYGALEPAVPTRFALGRPFVLSMAVLVVLCLLLVRAPAVHRWRALALAAGLLGVVIWMHPSWHLFFLPVLACLLARRFRLALWLSGALGLGVLVAGLLYGNPVEFAWQSVLHTLLAFGTDAPRARW